MDCMPTDRNAPVIAVLLLLSIFTGLVRLGEIVAQKSVPTVDRCDDVSVDYREVFLASRYLQLGWNPYEAPRYVYPPLPAQLNLLATHLPYEVVKYLVPFAVLASVLGALVLLNRTFAPPDGRADTVFVLATAGILSLSYPFQFLFDRGNLDGFVLLLVATGLFALDRAGGLSGLLFGLAVALKVYPILLALPLVAKGRWKAVAAMAALLFVLFELSMELWLFFLQDRVLDRGSQFRLDENGSLAATLGYVEWLLRRALGTQAGTLAEVGPSSLWRPTYLTLLALMVWRDARTRSSDRRHLCADLALYFPFMIAVPQLAYHYQLVWLLGLLPVVGWLWMSAEGRAERISLVAMTFGIALSQFPAVAMHKMIGSVLPQAVPGGGLLMAMLGAVAVKWTRAAPGATPCPTDACAGRTPGSRCDGAPLRYAARLTRRT
jgi:hypothetical protein